jgi:hypothetical protein
MLISKEPIPRFTPIRARTWRDAALLQAVFFSPAESAVTRLPKLPAVFTRVVSWAYSVSHAYGTVYDNPDLITLVMVGDGEAETGPLATSWHSNKFLNPITDGAVLPSCTSMATRLITRHYWPVLATKNWSRFSPLRIQPIFVEGVTIAACISDGRYLGTLRFGDPQDPKRGLGTAKGLCGRGGR